MTFEEIMIELESKGSEQTRRIFTNHQIPNPKFGVKVSDLKKIVKVVKKNYQLSMDLFASGNYDAMYLAGLIADEEQMTKDDLELWLLTCKGDNIANNTVSRIAAESKYGLELAKKWIADEDEITCSCGWSTYAMLVALLADDELEILEITSLLSEIEKTIHNEREAVKYQMNNFVICVGGYITALTKEAKACGDRIGKVTVDMGNTACKVPLIKPYIEKMEKRGIKKRKQARC